MLLNVIDISRTEPDSQILYRLKYRCKITGVQSFNGSKAEESATQEGMDAFFIVELSPLGERSVYWDFDQTLEYLEPQEQETALKILQELADRDQLPH